MSVSKYETRTDPASIPPPVAWETIRQNAGVHIDLGQRLNPDAKDRYPVTDISTTPIGDAIRTGAIPVLNGNGQPHQSEAPPHQQTNRGGGASGPTDNPPAFEFSLTHEESDRMDELLNWWMHEAERDAGECLSKLIEYGSADFDIMAHGLLATSGGKWNGAPEDERLRIGREMAIMFYLQGKVARAFGAFEKGRLPSADTLDDIVRYGVMLRRVRQFGAWG